MDGLLVLDKPQGLTSFDVVRRVRGVVRRLGTVKKPKVGHAGTLDPFATGVLPICVGRATRLAQYLIDGDKRYRATLRLGIATDTEDSEGQVIEEHPWQDLQPEVVRQTIESMVGQHMQTPPIYSAIRINGRRAYDMARAGEVPQMEPRPITIYSIDVESIDLPDVVFSVTASKGTYIRSLCRDIGQTLKVGGHCHALRRLAAAGFEEDESHLVEPIFTAEGEFFRARLLTPLEMLRALPLVQVSEACTERLRHGQTVPWEGLPEGDSPFRVSSPAGELVCVAKRKGEAIKPERVM